VRIGAAMDTVFAPYLDAHGGAASWSVWKAVLKSIHGEELEPAELMLWREVTGRKHPRAEGYARTFWGLGRSSGKTTAAAIEMAYETVRHARGKRADVVGVAQDSRRSAALLEVVKDLLELSPFAGEIHKANETELRVGRSRVLALPSAAASLRGYHGPVVVLDEVTVLRGAEGRYNDRELLRSAVPAVRPFGGRVFALGTPLGESGLMWDMQGAHKGRDTGVLFVFGPTWRFNGSITEADARGDAGEDLDLLAEYEGRFRSNLRALLDEDTIAALAGEYTSLPPREGESYVGFVDMSGTRSDSAALGIAHAEAREGRRRAVVDLLDEVPAPFNAEAAVERFAAFMKAYHITTVAGDLYGGDLYAQSFGRAGLRFESAPLDKSGLFVSFAVSARSGQVVTPNSEVLLRQLRWLEEKITPTKMIVRHAGPHDDVANACAGAVHLALLQAAAPIMEFDERITLEMPNPNRVRYAPGGDAQKPSLDGPGVHIGGGVVMGEPEEDEVDDGRTARADGRFRQLRRNRIGW